jgi:hypothetical protein
MSKEILYGELNEEYSLDKISPGEARAMIDEAYNVNARDVFEEATDSDYLYKISGPFARGGDIVRNDRMYPTRVLKVAIDEAMPKLRKGKFCGELDHPQGYDPRNGSLRNTAIRFTRLYMDGDTAMYEGIITTSSKGRELARLLESGVGAGVSTRGYGSTNMKDVGDQRVAVVQEGYELLGIDAVLANSALVADNINVEGEEVTESEDNNKGGKEMTLEELREKYPELVQSLEENLEEGLEKDFEQKVAKEIEERKDSIRKDILENDESIVALRNVAKEVREAIEPLSEDMANKELEEAKTKLSEKETEISNLKTEVKTLKAEKKELEEKLEEEEQKEKVEEALEEKVAGHKFEKQLRNRLADVKTVEELEERFEDEVADINEIVESLDIDVPAGSGITESEEDEEDEDIDEVKANERRLAGLAKNEGGSK